jgi:type III restriction enzyme
MNRDEQDCAAEIDRHRAVKRWVRNPEHETQGGFCLPKSPGKFFPDFIVELTNGGIAIVEYKNATLNQAAEEQHKKAIGELWAARSHGRCRFAWIVERNWPELDRVLTG